MVEHICQKCNKTFNHKGAYDRHLSRQKPCKLEQKLYLVEQKEIKINNIVKEIEDENECLYCNKHYTTLKSLRRHNKYFCVKNKIDNNLQDEIRVLKQKINELEKDKSTKISKSITNNNINNTNNGTINNNNITINQYGKEDLSHLTFNDFNGIFNKCNSCVPNLIDLIHFNKDKPENNNIYISNLKGSYAMIYDGQKWNVADKNTTVDDMYDDKCDILVSKYENLKDHLDEKTMNKFTKFLNKYEDEDIKKNITKNIKLMLYNNREIASK